MFIRPHSSAVASGPMKLPSSLQRVVAKAGEVSRRAAQSAVINGRVTLNGSINRNPALPVQTGDAVALDGRPLPTTTMPTVERLWRYHKPRGLIVTHKDPHGRPTIFDELPSYLPRVVTVGRLDRESEGLLLLTTSGSLARRLCHPTSQITREYLTCVVTGGERAIRSSMVEQLEAGITLKEGFTFAPMRVELVRRGFGGDPSGSGRQWVRMRLTEGKKHEVRRAWSEFGFSVTHLIRIAYGDFALDGLHAGDVAEVAPEDVQSLSERLEAHHAQG